MCRRITGIKNEIIEWKEKKCVENIQVGKISVFSRKEDGYEMYKYMKRLQKEGSECKMRN